MRDRVLGQDQLPISRDAREQVRGKSRDIAHALAQGRQLHLQHPQAVEKVFAEALLRHRLRQVLVRGRHDAQVHAQVFTSTDAREDLLLHEAQQLHLHGRRHLRDLIQEQRATGGALDVALPGRGRSGEGALSRVRRVPLPTASPAGSRTTGSRKEPHAARCADE